jgi:hypothetical protein
LFDHNDVDGLTTMAREFEDRAAAAMTRQLSVHLDSDTARDCAYAISRGRIGWVVSRGADRIATRPTLESAHEAAHRLLGFDSDFN